MQLVYVMKFVPIVLMDKRQTVVLQHVPSAQQVKCKPLQVLVFVKVVLLVVFNLQKLLLFVTLAVLDFTVIHLDLQSVNNVLKVHLIKTKANYRVPHVQVVKYHFLLQCNALIALLADNHRTVNVWNATKENILIPVQMLALIVTEDHTLHKLVKVHVVFAHLDSRLLLEQNCVVLVLLGKFLVWVQLHVHLVHRVKINQTKEKTYVYLVKLENHNLMKVKINVMNVFQDKHKAL